MFVTLEAYSKTEEDLVKKFHPKLYDELIKLSKQLKPMNYPVQLELCSFRKDGNWIELSSIWNQDEYELRIAMDSETGKLYANDDALQDDEYTPIENVVDKLHSQLKEMVDFYVKDGDYEDGSSELKNAEFNLGLLSAKKF